MNAFTDLTPSRTFATTGSTSSPAATRESHAAVLGSNSARSASGCKLASAEAGNPPSYELPLPLPPAPDPSPNTRRSAASTFSPSLPPKPLIERIGSDSIISVTARALTAVCLFGLFLADASFASILLCATPPLMVNPVRSNTAARISAHTCAPTASRLSCSLVDGVRGTTAPLARMPSRTISSTTAASAVATAASTSRVTSTYASSMLARSTCSHRSASADMTLHDARLYRRRLTLRDCLSCDVPSVFSVVGTPTPAASCASSSAVSAST